MTSQNSDSIAKTDREKSIQATAYGNGYRAGYESALKMLGKCFGKRYVEDAIAELRRMQSRQQWCPKCGTATFRANVDDEERDLCMNDECKWQGKARGRS